MTDTEKMNAYIWAAKVDSKGWFSVGGKRYRVSVKTAILPITNGERP